MARVHNFSAGPAALPTSVLAEIADEMMDYRGCGMSVLEMSHRSSMYQQIIDDAEANPRIPHVEVQVKVGRIRETLKEKMIDVIEPDIIVCGARGLSSIKYALLGSISTYLLRSCTCDILVVKRPAIAGASKPL